MLALSLVSEEIASKTTENCCCQQPHCRWTPPPKKIPSSLIMPAIERAYATFY